MTKTPFSSAAPSSLGGALAMVFVGSSVAVSGQLTASPLWTVQAIRYAIACALLLGACRMLRARVKRPTGVEWLWLCGVTLCGLVVFNVALVEGSKHAEPAVLGVAVACVPVILAVVGPLLEGHTPQQRALIAAGIVTVGAALVEGLGRSDGIGLLWAVVVFACEAGFTLLAVPVLTRHGAVGVAVHTTWLAAVMFAVLGVVLDGPTAVTALTTSDLLAILHLAVFVTALAFVLWYGSVAALGAARAGLLTGIAPVAAALTGVAFGRPVPGPGVWLGVAVVAAGLAFGFRRAASRRDVVRYSEAPGNGPSSASAASASAARSAR